MTAPDVPTCSDCGAAAVLCLVGVDRAALDAALLHDDVPTLAALRPWQCSGCGHGTPERFRTLAADAWLAALRVALATHDAARARADAARARFHARNARLAREAEAQAKARAEKAASNASKSAVEAALARARAARPR